MTDLERALAAAKNQRAFPTGPYQPGMSLRDYFAGQALAGLSSATDSTGMWTGPFNSAGARVTAERAYAVADAMLAARAGGDHA